MSVRMERSDGIAVLRLDRPPVNAIDLGLMRAAAEAFAEIERSDDVRALVVTGTGAHFSAGLDLKVVPTYGPEQQREMIRAANRMITLLYGLPLPTVGAVNGHAIAGGFVLAIACDYRVGTDAPACRIGLTEARAGIPFPAGPMAVVRAELAPPVVRRTTLEARNFGPDTALSDGILDEIQPPERVLARALEVAADLGSMPRSSYATIKNQVRGDVLAGMREAVASGADPLLDAWLTPETAAAAASLIAPRRKAGGRSS